MLNRLRSGTRDLHGLIETNPLHRAIVDGTVTRAGYLRLLQRMYGVHCRFEYWAGLRTEWSQFGFDFGERRRLALLERDLKALDFVSASALPAAPLPLEEVGFPFLLGYLYVLEGSTLGGQIMCRLIQRHLGLTPDSGSAYFHSCGALVGARWRACQELLSRAGAPSSAADEIVGGARDAFIRIDSWLRRE
jgi:heme oxygenase